MTFLTVKTVVTDAYYPRANRGSTTNENDRLQLVYNVYTDGRSNNKAGQPTANPHSKTNLMFLHGATFSKEVWEYIIEMFFDKYGDALGTVVALDAANHADSYLLNKGKLGWVYSWEDGGKDAVKVLRDLDLKGGTILIGHSMGGTSALHAAAVEKRLIDSVVSIEPVCYTDCKAYYNSPELRNTYYKLLKALNRSMFESFPTEAQYMAFMKKKNLTRTFHPRVLDDLLRANTLVDVTTGVTSYKTHKYMQLSSYASSILSTLYLPDLARTIDCEVCHMIGSKAKWNPPEAAPTLRAHLLHGTPVDIEDGEHLVSLERPEETFKAMQPFIEKRMQRIQELAEASYKVNPMTEQEREAYYWAGVEEAEKLFVSGKKLIYDRL